ncbi:transposable element Tcb2 transposase [Trichonephila clavipes]|nr:transposable element Tcb2 transposase [Trichonephila clavipes]
MIRKLEKKRSLTSVAEEQGISKSVASCAWRAFQIRGTTVRTVCGDRSRKTTADVYLQIVLLVKRARYQSASSIAQQLCTATKRQLSQFTMATPFHKNEFTAILNAASL